MVGLASASKAFLAVAALVPNLLDLPADPDLVQVHHNFADHPAAAAVLRNHPEDHHLAVVARFHPDPSSDPECTGPAERSDHSDFHYYRVPPFAGGWQGRLSSSLAFLGRGRSIVEGFVKGGRVLVQGRCGLGTVSKEQEERRKGRW